MRLLSEGKTFFTQFPSNRSIATRCFFCVLLIALPAWSQSGNAPIRPLITQPVNITQTTVLKGNVHPLAQARFDHGAAPDSLPMNRMLLVLRRSSEQETALAKLLDDQQDKTSPTYHKWLTPEQFGQQFGPSDQDIQTITNWLQSYGFQVNSISKGRSVIEFSGTAGQVSQAFRTSIHSYVVNGQQHWANATNPSIPTALVPAVAGVFTMHNFLKKPQVRIFPQRIQAKYVPGKQPQTTFPGPPVFHALSPADYGTIYDINPVWNPSTGTPITGLGVTIAVVGRTDLYNGMQDVQNFSNVFLSIFGGSQTTILNGPDPGDLGGGEELEGTLDVSWSHAIAPQANIDFVVSATTNTTDGVDLSELYIVDNNLANVMTESFGTCEAAETSAQATGIESLAQQAAAEGITYLVSSGDNGAEGCDNPDSEATATGPVSVSVLASTPYDTAVGGTMFNENGADSTYWSSTNNSNNGGSALSYIPENVWNESCTSAQCGQNAGIWAGSGGASAFFAKPNWQSGVSGIPSDGARDVPDVALTAAGHDFYLICLEGSCVPDSQGYISFAGVSGTSAAAPSFAGIMALVNQKMNGRQGLANYVLYKLAEGETLSQCNASDTSTLPASTCVFNDVTVGNNAVPGETGYGTSTAQYQSGVGYDLATGLGSVNVANLVNSWNSVTFRPTTTTLTLNSGNAISVTHGTPVPLDITVAPAPNSGTGVPTGTVELLGPPNAFSSAGNGVGAFTLSNGSVSSASTSALPGGSYSVTAQYSGDATFAPSKSTQVSVTINPEPSTTTVSAFTTDQNGNAIPFTTGSYGTFLFLRADVAGNSGQGAATGSVQITDNANSLGFWNLNSQGNTGTPQGIFPAVGTHSIVAAYGGDSSFKSSTSGPLALTITKASTTAMLQVTGATSSGTTLLATVDTSSFGNAPGGTVTFMQGSTAIGSAVPVTGGVNGTDGSAQATATGSFQLSGNQSLTAVYSGDANYSGSTSSPVAISPDFQFSTALAGSQMSLSPGTTGIATLNVTSVDNMSGNVTFACSGLPSETTCTFSPASVAVSGTAPSASTTLTVQTTAPKTSSLEGPVRGAALLAFGFMLMGGIFVAGGDSRNRKVRLIVGALVLFAIFLPFVGCGGGGGGGGGGSGGHSDPGTPAGTYTVTVTATSGTLSHNFTFSLAVQ